jgi:hypothetical protein
VESPHYWLPPPSTTTESQNLCPKYSPGASPSFSFPSTPIPSPFFFQVSPLGSPDSTAHDEPYPQPLSHPFSPCMPLPESLLLHEGGFDPFLLRFFSFPFHLLPCKPITVFVLDLFIQVALEPMNGRTRQLHCIALLLLVGFRVASVWSYALL